MSSAISNSMEFVSSNDDHKIIICKLCRLMYMLGWVTGTGGGLSIRSDANQALMTPSGVQKELIQPNELFTVDINSGCAIQCPSDAQLRLSQCSPLFNAIYQLRNARAVIHTHSKNVVLASILALEHRKGSFSEHGDDRDSHGDDHRERCGHDNEPMSTPLASSQHGHTPRSVYQYIDETIDEETSSWLAGIIQIGNFEMLKGIKGHGSKDTTTIPVIKNTEHERDLESSLRLALKAYPKTQAVLVERHGAYIWGQSWQEAKTQTECYDYLLEMAWRLKEKHH